MRRKSNSAKIAAKQTRLVLRRRILRVLEQAGTYEDASQGGIPLLRKPVALRIAALVRELRDT